MVAIVSLVVSCYGWQNSPSSLTWNSELPVVAVVAENSSRQPPIILVVWTLIQWVDMRQAVVAWEILPLWSFIPNVPLRDGDLLLLSTPPLSPEKKVDQFLNFWLGNVTPLIHILLENLALPIDLYSDWQSVRRRHCIGRHNQSICSQKYRQ